MRGVRGGDLGEAARAGARAHTAPRARRSASRARRGAQEAHRLPVPGRRRAAAVAPGGVGCALEPGPGFGYDVPVTRKRTTPAEQEGAPVALDPAEVERALAVLARVAEDRGALAGVDAATREALQRLAGEIARPDGRQRRKLRKALLKGEREARKARDGALRKGTGIQRLRDAAVFRAPLPALPAPGDDASRWSPGCAPAAARPRRARGPPPRPRADGRPRARRAAQVLRLQGASTGGSTRSTTSSAARAATRTTRAATPTADLRGRVALVTGARVKIGYQAAILLLRAGCRVVALTRFPRDAAARYAREPDFDAWQDRLTIYGIDLRHTPSVELLASGSTRRCRGSTSSSTTPARPCGGRRASTPTSCTPRRARSRGCRRPSARSCAEYEELREALRDHRPGRGRDEPRAPLAGGERRRFAPPREDARSSSSRTACSTRTCSRSISGPTTRGGSRSPRSRRSSCSRCCS